MKVFGWYIDLNAIGKQNKPLNTNTLLVSKEDDTRSTLVLSSSQQVYKILDFPTSRNMFLISYYLEIVPSLYGQVVLGGTRQKFLRWNRSLLVVHLLALSNIRKHKKSKRLDQECVEDSLAS